MGDIIMGINIHQNGKTDWWEKALLRNQRRFCSIFTIFDIEDLGELTS
jgi:hypothetical protein